MVGHGSRVRIVVAAATVLLACSTLEMVPLVEGRYALEPGDRIQVTLDDGRELLLIFHSAGPAAIVGTRVVRVASHRSHFEDPARVGTFTVPPNQMLRTVAQAPPAEPELVEVPIARVRSVQRDRWED